MYKINNFFYKIKSVRVRDMCNTVALSAADNEHCKLCVCVRASVGACVRSVFTCVHAAC